MKHLLRSCILAYVFIFLSAAFLHAQDGEKGPHILRADAEGTHFIVGFMQNEENRSTCALLGDIGPARQQIHIASRVENTITLVYPNGSSVVRSVSASGTASFILDGEEYECLGDGICDKSFRITAERPISVYCFSSKSRTTDGYLALPTGSWGTEYVTANYSVDHYSPVSPASDPDSCNVEPRRGEFAVIAAEDNTTVTVYPKTKTVSGGNAGEPMVRILQEGEIWQVQDGGRVRGASDLTGSRIVADKPVGVLSGHERAGIPWELDTKNHLIEMLPPVEGLGTRHVVVPFGGRNGGDIVRVIAAREGTTRITVRSHVGQEEYQVSGTGAFQELLVTQVSVIESDRPVLVAHYSQSNGIDETSDFDPYMIVTMPEEQFATASLFQTMPNGSVNPQSGKPQFDRHFLTIIMEKQFAGLMQLNGEDIMSGPGAIVSQGAVPGMDDRYLWMTLRLPGGQSFNIRSAGLFGGYVYGIGEFDSYGWPIGASTDSVAITPDITPPEFTAISGCQGNVSEVLISDSGDSDYGLLNVRLDSITSSNVRLAFLAPIGVGSRTTAVEISLIDPKKSGKAHIIAEDVAGNVGTLDLDLQSNPPVFSHDSLHILNVPVNTSHTEQIRISNGSSQRAVYLYNVQLTSGVVVTIDGFGLGGPINQFVNPGQSYDLSLTMRAVEPGTYHDTLVVYADCYFYYIPIVVNVGRSSVQVSNYDFGMVLVDDRVCVTVPIRNTGLSDIVVTDIQTEGPFRIDPSSLPVLPFVLSPGETRMIVICYSPQERGEHIGTIRVTTSAGIVTGVLQGIGIDEITSVDDPNEGDERSIAVSRHGNSIVLEAVGAGLSLKELRLVALTGEIIPISEVRQEGTGRLRIELPKGLPSGVYYLQTKDRDGNPIAVKVMVVK